MVPAPVGRPYAIPFGKRPSCQAAKQTHGHPSPPPAQVPTNSLKKSIASPPGQGREMCWALLGRVWWQLLVALPAPA